MGASPPVLYTLLDLRRMYSRSIIGIGTEPVPLVSCLLTTRYVRGIGTRIDRARLATVRRGGKKMGDHAESDAWYGRLTVLLARCVAAAAVMDLAHYRPEHTGVRPYRVMLKVALVQRGPISGHFPSARDIALFVDPNFLSPERKVFMFSWMFLHRHGRNRRNGLCILCVISFCRNGRVEMPKCEKINRYDLF